jgi:hypothetical protein
MNKMHYPLKTNHIPPSPAAPQAPHATLTLRTQRGAIMKRK